MGQEHARLINSASYIACSFLSLSTLSRCAVPFLSIICPST